MKKFVALLMATLLVSQLAVADSTQLKETSDFYSLGEEAYDRDVPILIMFSQKNCAYCIILEEEYLRPMLKSGEYKNKVIIRKVRLDSYDTLRNFDGSEIDVNDFASDYRYPTHTGQEYGDGNQPALGPGQCYRRHFPTAS